MPDASGKPTVLLVEDNPLNMTLASDLLTMNGFRVLQATEGEAAVELAKTHRPDLMLLDIRLPGIDGFEVFRRLRQDAALNVLKIVALTASVMKEDEEKIRAMGFTAYLPKPIDVKQFVGQVRALMSAP